MLPEEIIDKSIRLADNVDPDDDDNLMRRRRHRDWLQHIYNTVHNYRPWQWTWDETPIVVPGNATSVPIHTRGGVAGAIPNFLEFGREGKIVDASGIEYFEKSKLKIQRIRQSLGGNMSGYPFFGVFSGAIQFPYTFGSAVTNLTAFHRVIAEEIIDAGDEETNPAVSFVQYSDELSMPDTYHETVLLPGVIWKAQTGKKDVREDWGAQFREGLSRMSALEFPEKSQIRRMPLAVPGRAW